METKNLELEKAVLLAIGATSGNMLESGWVVEATLFNGKKRIVFINERSSEHFRDRTYSFTDEWLDYCRDHEHSLIAVVERDHWDHINIIDPRDPEHSGYILTHSADEFGDTIHNYTKIHYRDHGK